MLSKSPADETSGSINNEGSTTPEQQAFENETAWTRNGVTVASFGKRHYGRGTVELDRKLKSRHLTMIAIGGSIGSGFFVGSGSALSNGVCNFLQWSEEKLGYVRLTCIRVPVLLRLAISSLARWSLTSVSEFFEFFA